ncbi:putative major facilitator, sugar transporter, major facilitator superfamily [Plasmopara halstedii]
MPTNTCGPQMPCTKMLEPKRTYEVLQQRCAEDLKNLDDESYNDIENFKRHTWMIFSVVGGLIYGYNVSLAATLQYMRDDLQLTLMQEEILSATATLSDACSMLIGGYLADRFGRKATAMFACSCSIVGALLAGGASSSFSWMVVWRLFSGVGNGLSILLLPMYISECVNATNRGAFLTLFQLGVNLGVAVPYLFMIFISENWRACLAFGSLPALYVLYSFHLHFPESIKWLRWKERQSAHSKILDGESFNGFVPITIMKHGQHNSYQYLTQQEPVPALPLRTNSSATMSRHGELAVGLLLAYVNNCVDASLFYGPEIIAKTSVSFSSRDANIFGLVCSFVAVFSVIFAGRFVIAKFSRRQVYLICLAVVCLCFFVSGGIFAQYSTDEFAHNPAATASIMITFAILNVFAAVGPSILFVVILSELFHDNSYRARYMSYCTFAMSLISLLVNGSMLTLFDFLGKAATFLMYGVTYIACVIIFYVHLPETKQRQLL